MKKYLRASTQPDEFDKTWDAKFGEPTSEVFTSEEFLNWMKEVIEFEPESE